MPGISLLRAGQVDVRLTATRPQTSAWPRFVPIIQKPPAASAAISLDADRSVRSISTQTQKQNQGNHPDSLSLQEQVGLLKQGASDGLQDFLHSPLSQSERFEIHRLNTSLAFSQWQADPSDIEAHRQYLYSLAHANTTYAATHIPFSLAIGTMAALALGKTAALGLTWGGAAFLTTHMATNIYTHFIQPLQLNSENQRTQ